MGVDIAFVISTFGNPHMRDCQIQRRVGIGFDRYPGIGMDRSGMIKVGRNGDDLDPRFLEPFWHFQGDRA